MSLSIELLNRKHLRTNFSCGKDSLDRYLRRQASQDVRKQAASVFVLVDQPNLDVLAYYTLSAFSVEIGELDAHFAKQVPRYPRLPAALIGRLAVDQFQKEKGLGELMLTDALKRTLRSTEQMAAVAVLVEAIDKEAITFYEKYGFQQAQQTPLMLYLPVKRIKELIK